MAMARDLVHRECIGSLRAMEMVLAMVLARESITAVFDGDIQDAYDVFTSASTGYSELRRAGREDDLVAVVFRLATTKPRRFSKG
jgi:hypothetical protein